MSLGKVFFIWSVMTLVKVTGADALIKHLNRNATLDDVKKTVKLNGTELHRRMQRNATFTRGYQTGETKRTIEQQIIDDGLTAEVKPTTHYAPYLELGTRFMASQPFVKPSFAVQEKVFIKDMRRLMG